MPALAWLARSLLLAAALVMPLVLMTERSITSDETVHISAGYSYLATGRVTLNPMHPPLLKELSALPLLLLPVSLPADARAIEEGGRNVRYQWKFAEDFLSNVDVERVLFWARVPMVLLSLALAMLVFRWSAELWGTAGGLLSLFCYVFDPTIVAHAQLVTTDVGFAFFGTLFVYWLRSLLAAPSTARAIRAGFALGLALGAKFSAVVLLPVAALLVTGWAWMGHRQDDKRVVPRAIEASSVILLVAGALLWVIYLFPSDPLFYWHGFNAIYGDKNPGYYFLFLGEFSQSSWPSYFPVTWLIKTPIPVLLLSAGALVRVLQGVRKSWIDEVALLLPPAALFIVTSAFADPIGIRYLIPCFPFLYVFIGRLGARIATVRRPAVLAATLLLVWQLLEFFSIWPDHLTYFNEIAGGWRGGVAWLDDSNVDWGQNFPELRDYLAAHPRPKARLCNFVTPFNATHYGLDVTLISSDDALPPPQPGTLILSSHCVARVRAWLNSYCGNRPENWMARTQPTAIVGHTYYIYDIPERGQP